MTDNKLSIGQRLIVGNKGSGNEENPNTDEPKQNTDPKQNTEPVKPPKRVVINEKGEEVDPNKKNISGFEEVNERGFAAVIANSTEKRKYLALHRDAPIGTLMQVRNEMNNQSVFVRVVGRLPDTGNNDKLIIRLSNAAYSRLGALDNRFPVELSYVP